MKLFPEAVVRWRAGAASLAATLLCCAGLAMFGCSRSSPTAASVEPSPTPGAGATATPEAMEARPLTNMSAELPLIPRKKLFGNPDRAAVRISPDGKHIAWLAPLEGTLNIWLAPSDTIAAAVPITKETGRPLRSYFWAYNSRQIIYSRDKDGDENWRLYALNIETKEAKLLTPESGVQARVQNLSPRYPDELVISLNERDPKWHDLYRLHLGTGETKLIEKNDRFDGFILDDDHEPRLAQLTNPDASNSWFRREGAEWKEFLRVAQEDAGNTDFVGMDGTGNIAYLMDSRNRDTAALATFDLRTGEEKIVAQDPRADVRDFLAHPTTSALQAAAFEYDRRHWIKLDDGVGASLDWLAANLKGECTIASRTADDSRWIVAELRDDGPVKYFDYVRATNSLTFLFTNRKSLEGLPLSSMRPELIKSRDGLTLVSYLTLPLNAELRAPGRPAKPLPMVLDVHGGPWSRDSWGYSAATQLLANRGYAVLNVNYRGSSGFGKSFLNAGEREWGGKMHDDLIDAVQWAVAEGIADPAKVAITGGSYGGYATLVGLTFTPDTFAAGVAVVGPSNLVTFMNAVPPYWRPVLPMFRRRVGDETTEEGREFLRSRSPLYRAGDIRKPLLIAQGANDPRVKREESEQIVSEMQRRKIPVTYLLYPDEGHGFARPENSTSYMAISEVFLSRVLGGRAEPLTEEAVKGSVQVPVGEELIPGLKELLDGKAK